VGKGGTLVNNMPRAIPNMNSGNLKSGKYIENNVRPSEDIVENPRIPLINVANLVPKHHPINAPI
jgi:hypothetical protein